MFKKIIVSLCATFLLFAHFVPNLPQNENYGVISQNVRFQGNTNYANPFEQCTDARVSNTSSWATLYNLNNNNYTFNGANIYNADGSTTSGQALVLRFNNPMPNQFIYYISAYLNIYHNLTNPNGTIRSYFYRADGTIVNYENKSFFEPVLNTEYEGSWYDTNNVQYGIASFKLPYDDIVRFEIRTKWQNIHSGSPNNSFISISYGSFAETQYSLGYEDGFEEGEKSGYEDGFDAGFLEGGDNIALSFFNATMKIIELVFRSLGDLLSTEIVRGTPITMGLVFLGVPGAFMILGGVINLVRRLLGG